MIEFIVLAVLALVIIAGAAVAGPRLGIASPLLLVLTGILASLTFLPDVEIDPELILEVVLPPLLYSAAVSMPAMNFRREFGAISSLSVVLVVASSLVLGVFFALVIPDLGFAWGVALGAIVSPTDAVATSMIKGTPVSRRVVAILEGESLLNDATALVLLRTAIVATAATFSFWGTLGTFLYAVAVAAALGIAAGYANLAVRRRVPEPRVNTVLSFAVPFAAAVPAELLGGSGLVAAVAAGLVTGIRAPRVLPARHRVSDAQNWASLELVLEGAVFLLMGLQLSAFLAEIEQDHDGVLSAVLVAAAALAIVLLVRAAYVSGLLLLLARRARRGAAMQPRLTSFHERMSATDGGATPVDPRGGRRVTGRRRERLATRVRRVLADIDYLLTERLGPREGFTVVWAGMRGAVTVAAAQTLPADTPDRSLLVFIAFAVAGLSLLVQGGTIGPIVGRLYRPDAAGGARRRAGEDRRRIRELLVGIAGGIPREEGAPRLQHRLTVIAAQRNALLDARDDGAFDADALADALRNLDAEEVALELRDEPEG